MQNQKELQTYSVKRSSYDTRKENDKTRNLKKKAQRT